MGVSLRTVQRYKKNANSRDRRKGAQKKVHNKLTSDERKQLLHVACSPELCDLSASQIVPILASRGEYYGSERTLYRLLKAENLNTHRRRERPPTYQRPQPLIAEKPNQVWSWDVTYLPSKVMGKHFYCYLFLDVFSRKIVAWQVHEKECSKLASSLFLKACSDEAVSTNSLSLHQDNGSIMKAAEFLTTLRTMGVNTTYSRPGVSDDNPYSEALFKTLKYRTWYPERPFCTVEDARGWMTRFSDWYNNRHLHSAISFVTPNQRHYGEDVQILETRDKTYKIARLKNPERWSKATRNWNKSSIVVLNPKGKSA